MRLRQALALGVTVVWVGASLVAATADVRLVEAAKKRDKTAVRSLVRQRVNVNTPDVEGMTAAALDRALERSGNGCAPAQGRRERKGGQSVRRDAAARGQHRRQPRNHRGAS